MRIFSIRVIPGLLLLLGIYNFSYCGLQPTHVNARRTAVQKPADTDLALTPAIVNLTQKIPGLDTDVRYATTHNFTGQVLYDSGTPYLVAEAAESLLAVQNELKTMGLQVLVFDGYRPLAVQRKMWKIYPDSRYVANPANGSRHNRGCAVDLTLADSTGQPLEMPTGYDDFTEKGIPVDEKFALDISELNAEDWILTFDLSITHPVSVLIERTLSNLREKKKKFWIKDIFNEIENDKKSEKETINATIGLFEAAETWGVFSNEEVKPTKIKDLISPGKTSVLDLSVYNSVGAFNIRALVISIVSRKLFNERMFARKLGEIKDVSRGLDYTFSKNKKETPLIWMFIDEAHEFLPLTGKTIATDALIQILREGRQPGISLVLATQQPGQIHRDVMTQSDIVISHRVTSKPDIEALNQIMQTYLTSTIQKYMNDLPSLQGSAIVLDDNSERIYPMRIRPRFTWHGGQAPTALSEKKKL